MDNSQLFRGGILLKYSAFSPKQVLALGWWNKKEYSAFDAIVCDGAVRSGKTLSLSDGFFLWSMSRFQNQVFALCGKTVGALRRNIITHLPGWLGDVFTFRESRSENKIIVLDRRGRKNTYYLFGGQDESSAGLIQGITLAGVLLDEVALMPRSFVEQAVARCSVKDSKMWFNCNPGSPQHWFYKEWIQKAAQKNVLHLHFTMDDNPALDEAVKRRYESLYTGLFYRRFVLGQWCAAEGLVYEFEEEKHTCLPPADAGRYYISIDYGTRNPFSAGLWWYDGSLAIRLREYYYDGREKGIRTDQEHYRAVEELAGDLPVEKIIIDPSAASFIATVRRQGRFRVRKARNEVLPGLQLVSGLLRQGRLMVTKACRDAIREFGLYRWAEDDTRDAPLKENDHAMDDIRYFCMSVMRN